MKIRYFADTDTALLGFSSKAAGDDRFQQVQNGSVYPTPKKIEELGDDRKKKSSEIFGLPT